MAVEDAEAPCGEYEQRCAGEEDADELDGKQPRLALEAVGDDIDERGREDNAQQYEHRGDEIQQHEDGGSGASGLLVALLGIETRVDGDKRCRKDAFAEEVLEHVGDAEGGLESIGGKRVAEVVGEDALADEADELGEQDAGGDRKRGGPAVRLLRFGQVGQVGGRGGFGHAWFGFVLAYLPGDRRGSVQWVSVS